MIELIDIRKSYRTGSFEQRALDGVSITFRENEFAAVLGPSGSGKTTLLNIIGGLDHADSGDIVINGVSTQKYRSRDWDAYRNHRIGFIFQSYNLIPHQSILKNVELALTIGGVNRAERKRRAREALEIVGLADHIGKKPSQLSGGQQQRVAVARALVNDPDIVLADEPTGALDSETGTQIMDLLAQIAKDRLVIMVSHNEELAHAYANRFIHLADGRVTHDNRPVTEEERAAALAAVAEQAHPEEQPAPKPEETDAEGVSDTDVTAEIPKAFDPEKTEELPTADEENTAETPTADADTTAELPAAAAEATTTSEPVGTLPVVAPAAAEQKKSRKRKDKASMSFLTALSLSFSNLMTKKTRTILTAFAGSIGIIGIAAILALSNGVNNYIAKVEEETLSSYPITITKSSVDFSSLMTDNGTIIDSNGEEVPTTIETTSMGTTAIEDGVSEDGTVTDTSLRIPERTVLADMFAKIKTNDLKSFRAFLESDESGIDPYVNLIDYNYGIEPHVYKADTSNGIVQLNPALAMSSVGTSGMASMSALMSGNSFTEMIDDRSLLESQYTVVCGRWPESYDECILVLDSDGTISDYTLYNMGILDPEELQELMEQTMKEEELEIPDTVVSFTYEDALGTEFKVVNVCDFYQYNESQGTWTDMSDDKDFMTERVNEGLTLRVVGVVKPLDTTVTASLFPGIAYTSDLTMWLIDQAAESDIVKQQLDNPDTDVFTGKSFEELQSEEGASIDMSSFFSIDEDAFANAFQFNTGGFSMPESSGTPDMGTGDYMSGMDMDSIVAGMPMPDFTQMESGLSDDQIAEISVLQSEVVAGFLPYWYSVHPGEAITEETDLSADLYAYMQTDAAQSNLNQIASIVGTSTNAQVEALMQNYMANDLMPYMQGIMESMVTEMAAGLSVAMEQELAAAFSGMNMSLSVDENAFANAIHFDLTEEDLTSIITNYANASQLTYDNNLIRLGYCEKDNPQSISIYPKDFESKNAVLGIIDGYNEDMMEAGEETKVISYSDIMGELVSSVTSIVNIISDVLIAFVSISLVVSSIMIGIITYISVLERRKEIGILRANGASKRNIANIFNAETFIEGLIAGVFAIAAVSLLSIPVNKFILETRNVENVMALTWENALILIAISVILTIIAGLIPARKASRRDPVEALRSE